MALLTDHWIRYRHLEHQRLRPKWNYTWTHYLCDPDTLRTSDYLVQRTQGEHITAYNERLKTSDYLPLFATAVDAINGRIMQKEPIKRRWQKDSSRTGLGRLDDLESTAYKIWSNADGQGASYLTQVSQAGIRLVALHWVWVYVRGIPRDADGNATGEATIHVIDPQAIVNWTTDAEGDLVSVLLETNVDMRGTDITQEPKEQKEYILFEADGTTRFRVDPETNEVSAFEKEPYGQLDDQAFSFWKTKKKKKNILPIFRVSLPLSRFVGYILATKNNVLFNQESERDNLLRIACTPQFVYVGTDDQFHAAQEARKHGYNAMQLDPNASHQHYYTGPPVDPAKLRTDVLRDKVADFFISTFRFYEDSVRGKQKTATEISQDVKSGEGTFLNILATGLDAVENGIGWRLEQIYHPTDMSAWGQFHVERKRDFSALSAVEEAFKLKEMAFGSDNVPWGETARRNAAARIADSFNLEYDVSEMTREIADYSTAPEPEPPPTVPMANGVPPQQEGEPVEADADES